MRRFSGTWVRRSASLFPLCLLALLGGAFSVSFFGAQTFHWQAFAVNVSIRPAWHGQTRLVFTPLGEIRAQTHHAPLLLQASLQEVNLEQIHTLIAHPQAPRALERAFTASARRRLIGFSQHEVLCGMLGGLLAPLLLRARRAREWLAAALIGGGSVAGVLLLALHTFDRRAFDNLTYVGSLRQAGTVIGLARTGFGSAQKLSDRLRGVAANVNTLYGRINAMSATGGDTGPTIRILHISDIHNNPAAVGFVQALASRFDVQAVVDTGDLTDFGTPVEARLTHGLGLLRVPHVFVAGNHDSQATLHALLGSRNTIILSGQLVQVVGLTMLGLPDPSSARAGVGSVDTSAAALAQAGAQLAANVRALPQPPDIVCVHNPSEADALLGKVPLILCGHLHRAYVTRNGASIVCNAGTTGGAGLRYFDRTEGVPLSAAVLTWTRSPHPRLLSVDMVVLSGSLSEYSITHSTFGEPDTRPAPALPHAPATPKLGTPLLPAATRQESAAR